MTCSKLEIIKLLKQCVVIGCGSHASSVISIIESCAENYEILGVVDTAADFDPNEKKSGYNVIFNIDELLSFPDKYAYLDCVLAIGDNQERKKIFDLLIKSNFKLPNIISSNSFIDRTVIMGNGNVIAHTAVINAQTILGNNNLINTGSLIEHDCKIKDHTHIGPRSILCGSVQISDFAFTGAGTTIVPDVFVAEATIIAAGAVLISDVTEKSATYIGVPARNKNR